MFEISFSRHRVIPNLILVVSPPGPTIPDTTPGATIVAVLQGVWSNTQPFTGTYLFVAPNYDGSGSPPSGVSVATSVGGITSTGPYAIILNPDFSGSLIINPNGPGVGGAGGTIEHCTIEATQ